MIATTSTRWHPRFSYYALDQIIGRSLDLYGEYAGTEIDLLMRCMDHRSVVYDVGANIGVHTVAFAAQQAKVWAFEPNGRNFRLLKQNCHELSNVLLVQAAVGNSVEPVMVEDFDQDQPGNFGNLHINSDRGDLVQQIRLDEFDAPDPDVIKIDVEGHELAVIQGAWERIRSNLPLVYYEAQESADLAKIWHMFHQLDYTLYWNTVMNYNPHNWKKNTNNVFGNSAIFCILAAPPGFVQLALDPVVDPDDTWQAYCQRLNQRNAGK